MFVVSAINPPNESNALCNFAVAGSLVDEVTPQPAKVIAPTKTNVIPIFLSIFYPPLRIRLVNDEIKTILILSINKSI